MSDQQNHGAPALTCAECRQRLPAYLDEDLTRTQSMEVFLHLRGCAGCAQEHDRHRRLLGVLEALPRREPPPDLDARILAAVPYEAYRAMAALREPRVPVFLTESALPGWVRARSVRWTGAAAATVVLAGHAAGLLPDGSLLAVAVGLVPEVLVRLQGAGRRLVLAFGQTRRGG